MRQIFGNIWLVSVSVGYLVAAWRLSDWRNWRQYYPTILFVAVVDFIVSLLTYEHPLWYFHRSVVAPNHTIADFFVALTNFPPMVLLFLTYYPSPAPLVRQIRYLLAWGLANSVLEVVFLWAGMISYHNGWNLWWSILLWHLMFLIVRLHAQRPWWAWLTIMGFAIGGVLCFRIPVAHLK